jgi:methyl-accepting chemotaxis protein
MLLAAADDRVEVDRAAQMLSSAAQSLHEIADLERLCNTEADTAIKTTQAALSAVNNTVTGINSTRDVIRETEKRIKRLGERSQEISGVVNLINVIAERTHILALNASMHAASAGEAGRGFAVVADEVQRLAENARQATQQITALVNNIQIETADTVNTMNDAISQIVEGSRLAEEAGQQMNLTQKTTADLVASVKQIAASSEEQAKAGQELLERAETLKQSSQQASDRLNEQSGHTNSLVEYAKQLLTTVRVFKLPG